MNYILVAAATHQIARDQAVEQTGYAADAIGRLCLIVEEGDSSRQKAFIFEVSKDVTVHARYTKTKLSELCNIRLADLPDGPALLIGREVTVGG